MLTTDLTTEELAIASGLFGGMFMAVTIIGLVVSILMIVAGWKIFEKAGEKGWKALIPIYNLYIFFKIVKMEKWFFAILIVSFLAGFIPGVMGVNTSDLSTAISISGNIGFALFISVAASIFAIVVDVIHSIRLSKAFGHGGAFAVGLIFLTVIFALILGFEKSKYNKKLVDSWK